MKTTGVGPGRTGNEFSVRRPTQPARGKEGISLAGGQLVFVRTICVCDNQLIFARSYVVVTNKSNSTPVGRKRNRTDYVGENFSRHSSERRNLEQYALRIVLVVCLVVNVGAIRREGFSANAHLSRWHNLHVAISGHLPNPQTLLPAIQQHVNNRFAVG